MSHYLCEDYEFHADLTFPPLHRYKHMVKDTNRIYLGVIHPYSLHAVYKRIKSKTARDTYEGLLWCFNTLYSYGCPKAKLLRTDPGKEFAYVSQMDILHTTSIPGDHLSNAMIENLNGQFKTFIINSIIDGKGTQYDKMFNEWYNEKKTFKQFGGKTLPETTDLDRSWRYMQTARKLQAKSFKQFEVVKIRNRPKNLIKSGKQWSDMPFKIDFIDNNRYFLVPLWVRDNLYVRREKDIASYPTLPTHNKKRIIMMYDPEVIGGRIKENTVEYIDSHEPETATRPEDVKYYNIKYHGWDDLYRTTVGNFRTGSNDITPMERVYFRDFTE